MDKKLTKANSNDRIQWLNLISITFSHHIHDIYTAFIPALQNVIIEVFSLNNKLFGLLSVGQRIPTLFNPFIGILAERVRIRYLMIAAPTITAISMSLMGSVSNYVSLLALVFISGLGSSLFHVPTPVMMKHVSGKKPGVGMGFYMFGGEFARTIGPVVAVAAADLWGFSGMFRLIPAGVLSSLLLFWRFRNVDLRKEFPKAEKEKGSHLKILGTYKYLLLAIALVTFVRGGMKSFLTYYLVGHLIDIGWPEWKAALGLSIIYLTGTAGSFISGIASDFIGKRTTLLLSVIFPPLVILGYLYCQFEMSFAVLGIAGFLLLANTPVFLSIVNTIKSKHITYLNGIYMTSIFLMSALATMLTGTSLDVFGNDFTLKLVTYIALIAIPLIIFMPLKTDKQCT